MIELNPIAKRLRELERASNSPVFKVEVCSKIKVGYPTLENIFKDKARCSKRIAFALFESGYIKEGHLDAYRKWHKKVFSIDAWGPKSH